jgi:hypothetical protein
VQAGLSAVAAVTTTTAMSEPTTTRRSSLATRRLVSTADPVAAVHHCLHNANYVTAVTRRRGRFLLTQRSVLGGR